MENLLTVLLGKAKQLVDKADSMGDLTNCGLCDDAIRELREAMEPFEPKPGQVVNTLSTRQIQFIDSEPFAGWMHLRKRVI